MTGLHDEWEPKWRKRRSRSGVTFQGSEVRAHLFPIQPMLWVLFQKVLSLANGPWSHEHMSPEEEVREVQTARKEEKKKKELEGETQSTTHTAEIFTAPDDQWESVNYRHTAGRSNKVTTEQNQHVGHQKASHNININARSEASMHVDAPPPPGHQAKGD